MTDCMTLAQEETQQVPNQRAKLRPPEGTIWRGATITYEEPARQYIQSTWMEGADPRDFEEYYNVPLHIYRSFNNKSNHSIVNSAEYDWVTEGGIVFYSIQIEKPWSDWRACPDPEDEDAVAADDALVGTQGEGGIYSPCGGKDREIRKYARRILPDLQLLER